MALWIRTNRGLDAYAAAFELGCHPTPVLVVPDRGEERACSGEPRKLNRGHRTAPGGLRPGLARVHDLPGRGNVLDPYELDPLDMADDGDLHRPAVSHLDASARYTG